MSQIENLIKKHCPNGVEFKKLGEVAPYKRGLGLSKKDKGSGNNKIILYGELYTTYGDYINDIVSFASDEAVVKSRQISKNSLLLPISSTTKEAQIGKASVLKISNVYLGGDAIYLTPIENVNPDYLMYVINSKKFEIQKMKCVSGTTIQHLSPDKLMNIKIPVPPIEVQNEIVKILDSFTKLEAELEARRRQYRFYRDRLLSFDTHTHTIKWVSLGEVARYSKDRISFEKLNEFNYVGVENLLQNRQGKVNSNYVPNDGNFTAFCENDILIGNIRPYLKKIWFANLNGGTNGDVLVLQNLDNNQIYSKFLFYVLASDKFFAYDIQNSKGAKMPRGDKQAILKFKFPLPNLEKQKEIVEILDKFDCLVNDLSTGLPAEINARRKQYEFYRDKLLSFDEA